MYPTSSLLFLESGEIACLFYFPPYVPFYWIEGESRLPPRSPPGGYDVTTNQAQQIKKQVRSLDISSRAAFNDLLYAKASARTIFNVSMLGVRTLTLEAAEEVQEILALI